MSTINNQPIINPHMKLAPNQRGVIQPPAVYSYSLSEELKLGEKEYKKMLDNMNKSKLAIIAEKHPNLGHNILGVIKYSLGIASVYLGYRYRHSIPILKSICRKPQKTPPSFRTDFQRFLDGFTRK